MFLTNSELRRKLLAYFFSHPDESFYVREIAAFIKEDPGNVSRDLRRLEEEGLFNSLSRGRTKYYSLNRSYPLFDEYKKIVFKTFGVEGSLRELVRDVPEIEKAYLHGSFAKNRENAGSDIDVVIVGRLPNDFVSKLRRLENDLGREINISSYTREEFTAAKAEKGSFLNIIFKNKIAILK